MHSPNTHTKEEGERKKHTSNTHGDCFSCLLLSFLTRWTHKEFCQERQKKRISGRERRNEETLEAVLLSFFSLSSYFPFSSLLSFLIRINFFWPSFIFVPLNDRQKRQRLQRRNKAKEAMKRNVVISFLSLLQQEYK